MEVGEFCGFLCGTEQESSAALGNKIHTTNDRKGRFYNVGGSTFTTPGNEKNLLTNFFTRRDIVGLFDPPLHAFMNITAVPLLPNNIALFTGHILRK